MPPLTDQRLAQAAFLYYVENLSQAEVARRLGVSRSNVSRMLSAAREKNLVRFEIAYPAVRDGRREAKVLEFFSGSPLREVVVAEPGDPPTTGGVGSLLAVCRSAGEWLSTVLADDLTLALSWGGTIQAFVDSARVDGRWNVQVVQLAGEASLDPQRSGHDLVRDLAERIGGTYSYFHAPAVAPSEEVAESLRMSPVVGTALGRARHADIALLGVGQFNAGSTRTFLKDVAQATPDEVQEAHDKEVVGQICGRFFDRDGSQVDLSLSRRVLSIDLEDLRNIPCVAVLASGPEKAAAVRAAVLGGFAHVLIIDSELADEVLAPDVSSIDAPVGATTGTPSSLVQEGQHQ